MDFDWLLSKEQLHLILCCETYVVAAACGPLTPAGRPSSSAASSFCFNETPGRFWKALEQNAVHPIQTAASSPVPASFGPNPGLPPVGCPVATATANRTGWGPAENSYGFSRCHGTGGKARLWCSFSVTLHGNNPLAARFYSFIIRLSF